VFASPGRSQFQAVERTLACQRYTCAAFVEAVLSGNVAATGHQCQQRVMPQLLMVVEILVSQSNPPHTLSQKFFDSEFDRIRTAVVSEGLAERPQDAEPFFDLPQQQSAGVRRDPPAIERRRNFPPSVSLEQQLLSVTLCSHETASCCDRKAFLQKTYARNGGFVHSMV
jgi:hypothetical protein